MQGCSPHASVSLIITTQKGMPGRGKKKEILMVIIRHNLQFKTITHMGSDPPHAKTAPPLFSP